MRDCEHMKRHLRIHTDRDGEVIRDVSVCDPFHTTTVVCGWSFWGWLKMLFRWHRTTTITIRVDGDEVAIKRWFQGQDTCERCLQTKIGPFPGVHETEPGYHHGDERWCEKCHYGYEPAASVANELSNSRPSS